jgi:hypothetical protein
LLGGHSFRVSGAQRLAALGVEVAKIMIMARWAGESVLRYVREAPLETLPKEVIALEEQRNLVTTLRALRKEVHELSTKVVDTEAAGEVKVKNLEARIASVSADMVQRVVAEPDRIIIARVARRYKYKVHTAFGNDFQAPPADWKTKCGRSFGLWNFTRHERIDEFPADARCRFCFGRPSAGAAMRERFRGLQLIILIILTAVGSASGLVFLLGPKLVWKEFRRRSGDGYGA